MSPAVVHQPVLLQTSLDLLNIKPGEAYLDCTIGSAGHALEILKKGGKLYGLDVDPAALKRSKERLHQVCPNAFFRLTQANFAQLQAVAKNFGLSSVAGILLDLGLSSEQLADKTRGFSFQLDAPLDMRADPRLKVTAADLVNGLHRQELSQLFKKLGEEPQAALIAQAIVQARQSVSIQTTLALARLIDRTVHHRGRLHPATRVFQALRIAVNDELNNLRLVLPQAEALLKPKGRLVVISFHSLEDRIVKQFIRNSKQLINLTRKPLRPSQDEIAQNPASRSAKLRAAEKK